MSNYIGRTFTHHGVKGAKQEATVIAQGEPKGKAGRIIVTVRLADGTEYKTDSRSVPEEIVFAPPAKGPMFTGRDQYYYDRSGRIFCR